MDFLEVKSPVSGFWRGMTGFYKKTSSCEMDVKIVIKMTGEWLWQWGSVFLKGRIFLRWWVVFLLFIRQFGGLWMVLAIGLREFVDFYHDFYQRVYKF